MTVRRHRRYSTEFKIQLVQAYLDGEGSARSIATRHEVPHRNLSTTMGHSTGLIREQCPVW